MGKKSSKVKKDAPKQGGNNHVYFDPGIPIKAKGISKLFGCSQDSALRLLRDGIIECDEVDGQYQTTWLRLGKALIDGHHCWKVTGKLPWGKKAAATWKARRDAALYPCPVVVECEQPPLPMDEPLSNPTPKPTAEPAVEQKVVSVSLDEDPPAYEPVMETRHDPVSEVAAINKAECNVCPPFTGDPFDNEMVDYDGFENYVVPAAMPKPVKFNARDWGDNTTELFKVLNDRIVRTEHMSEKDAAKEAFDMANWAGKQMADRFAMTSLESIPHIIDYVTEGVKIGRACSSSYFSNLVRSKTQCGLLWVLAKKCLPPNPDGEHINRLRDMLIYVNTPSGEKAIDALTRWGNNLFKLQDEENFEIDMDMFFDVLIYTYKPTMDRDGLSFEAGKGLLRNVIETNKKRKAREANALLNGGGTSPQQTIVNKYAPFPPLN